MSRWEALVGLITDHSEVNDDQHKNGAAYPESRFYGVEEETNTHDLSYLRARYYSNSRDRLHREVLRNTPILQESDEGQLGHAIKKERKIFIVQKIIFYIKIFSTLNLINGQYYELINLVRYSLKYIQSRR